MSSADTRYYRERAEKERAMALASERQEVREIHEELARQYEALVDRAELRPTLRIFAPSNDRDFGHHAVNDSTPSGP